MMVRRHLVLGAIVLAQTGFEVDSPFAQQIPQNQD
jgi:hypothetical protein